MQKSFKDVFISGCTINESGSWKFSKSSAYSYEPVIWTSASIGGIKGQLSIGFITDEGWFAVFSAEDDSVDLSKFEDKSFSCLSGDYSLELSNTYDSYETFSNIVSKKFSVTLAEKELYLYINSVGVRKN